MKEQIEILMKLQEVETEAANIRSLLDSLPAKLEGLETRLGELKQSIEESESVASEMRKTYRVYDSDTQTNLLQMGKSQGKLRTVKTNKEYQSLLKEIEEAKQRNSKIEDKMLECLDRIEEEDDALEKKRETYEELSGQLLLEKDDLRKEGEAGEKRLARLEARRADIAKTIEPGLLQKFNMIRDKRQGLAVVSVQDAICQGCHLNIPPQMFNEIQRLDSLRVCPNCQRMLYWGKI